MEDFKSRLTCLLDTGTCDAVKIARSAPPSSKFSAQIVHQWKAGRVKGKLLDQIKIIADYYHVRAGWLAFGEYPRSPMTQGEIDCLRLLDAASADQKAAIVRLVETFGVVPDATPRERVCDLTDDEALDFLRVIDRVRALFAADAPSEFAVVERLVRHLKSKVAPQVLAKYQDSAHAVAASSGDRKSPYRHCAPARANRHRSKKKNPRRSPSKS